MTTHFPLLPARPQEIRLLEDLVEGFAGLVPADQGVIGAFRQTMLADRHGVLSYHDLPGNILRFL